MATLQEIVDRAIDIAAGAIDGPLQNADMLAQSLLPTALHMETTRSALDPYTRTLFRRALTISITNNVGNFPDEALTAYACTADVIDENGDNAGYSHYNTFLRSPDPRMAHWAVRQGTEIHYLPVGGGAYSNDIEVTIPCVPEIPALATDQIVMPEEAVDGVVETLARLLVGAYKGALG